MLGHETLTMSPMPGAEVKLSLAPFCRHVHINGTTSTGKSTPTADRVCAGLLEQRVPTVVLDRTGE